jgi:hypothetical protein
MKINFLPFKKNIEVLGRYPVPSVKSLPSWYPKMPRFVNEEKKFKFSASAITNATIKWCNPFLDSLSAGYFILLENDLNVEKTTDIPYFSWKSGGEGFITLHEKTQISPQMIPSGFNAQPFKFLNNWSVKTPKGYSALFVHPLNRADLPFYTLSGFVDTDDYNIPVNLPFLIRDDFEGIIPAGTPIAQVIPIKRESWSHEIKPYSEDFTLKSSAKFNSTIYRAYKNLFWKRKDYK